MSLTLFYISRNSICSEDQQCTARPYSPPPPPPPPARLTALAALCLLLLAGTAQAQVPPPPPQCTDSTCTVSLASVSQVVDGCGDSATPGRFKVILSSSNPNVTPRSFTTVKYLSTRNVNRPGAEFTDWEWRTPDVNRNAWQNVLGGRDSLIFAGGSLGDTIIEVRPKAGARIWSNRNANNPNEGPGELVVPVITPAPARGRGYATAGSAYFLFMGGKGCARVGPGGGLLGGNQ